MSTSETQHTTLYRMARGLTISLQFWVRLGQFLLMARLTRLVQLKGWVDEGRDALV